MVNTDKRFLITYGTPLMDGNTLHNYIGFLGDTTSSDDILNGTYEYPGVIDEHKIQLLSQLSEIEYRWTVPRPDISVTV